MFRRVPHGCICAGATTKARTTSTSRWQKILPIVLKAKPQAISFEAANPRHEHEWTVWRETKLPDDKVLIPGVIDTCTNYIEHPELVAQRICRFADVVGRERVIAGTDCGFSTSVGTAGRVDREIAFRKLGVAGGRCADRIEASLALT